MSIYDAEQKLKPYVTLPDDQDEEIVALYNHHRELKLKDYTPAHLKSITETYPDVKIKFKYWNYNFCDASMIQEEEINRYIMNTTTVILDKHDYFLGAVICVTYFYTIMLHCYTLSRSEFDNYFNKITIDLNIVRDNFCVNRIKFKLNQNVMYLLTKLFDNSTIHKIIHKYTLDEIKEIYNYFEVDDIHTSTRFLLRQTNEESQIETIQYLVEKNDKYIDSTDEVVITDSTYHLGFYLLTIKNFKNIEYLNLYKTLLRYKCSFNFKMINLSPTVITEIQERLKTLNEMLVKWK